MFHNDKGVHSSEKKKILNVYSPNSKVSKCMKQNIMNRGKIAKIPITVGGFNTFFSQ